MKRKWILSFIVLTMSIGLMACKADESVEVAESSNEVIEEAQTSEEAMEVEEESVVIEEASTEIIEQKSEPSWYMDAEGVKNEELGIIIKKDNGIFGEVELVENLGIFTPHESGNGGSYRQNVFNCTYYDGEFADYIAEYGMEKGTINGIEYAYKENKFYDNEVDEEILNSVDVAIGGNGIVVYSVLHASDFNEGESVNDYLSRIDLIKSCSDFSLDCLAYIAEDGLYCPALGISLSIAGAEHYMGRISVDLNTDDYTSSIWICDESIQNMGVMYYMSETNGAQEVVDKYVEGALEPNEYQTVEYVAIDGTVEENIGNSTFLGRGLVGKYEWDDSGYEFEEWFFYSDNSTWSVSVDYDKKDGVSYENYLGVFEALE